MIPISKKLVNFVGGNLPKELSIYNIEIRVRDEQGETHTLSSPNIKYLSMAEDNTIVHLEKSKKNSTKLQFSMDEVLEIKVLREDA